MCVQPSCISHADFAHDGDEYPSFCGQHREYGMTQVCSASCLFSFHPFLDKGLTLRRMPARLIRVGHDPAPRSCVKAVSVEVVQVMTE